jgi:hypothetical protein
VNQLQLGYPVHLLRNHSPWLHRLPQGVLQFQPTSSLHALATRSGLHNAASRVKQLQRFVNAVKPCTCVAVRILAQHRQPILEYTKSPRRSLSRDGRNVLRNVQCIHGAVLGGARCATSHADNEDSDAVHAAVSAHRADQCGLAPFIGRSFVLWPRSPWASTSGGMRFLV